MVLTSTKKHFDKSLEEVKTDVYRVSSYEIIFTCLHKFDEIYDNTENIIVCVNEETINETRNHKATNRPHNNGSQKYVWV